MIFIPGASCQEYFVRKASRNYQASTHLLCQNLDGNKYKAAVKWNIPVVSQEWLFACAASGTSVAIDDYPVHNDSEDVEVKGAACGSENLSTDMMVTKEDAQKANVRTGQEDVAMEIGKASSVAAQSAFSHKIECPSTVNSDQPTVDAGNGNGQKRPTKRPSIYNRPFRPSFDLADVMEELASPVCPSVRSRRSRASRSSFPLDDFFAENIKQTLQKLTTVAPPTTNKEPQQDDGDRTTDDEQQEEEVRYTYLYCVWFCFRDLWLSTQNFLINVPLVIKFENYFLAKNCLSIGFKS